MEQGHYPYPAAIDSYGAGGFRFAEMSHKGSLLFLPSGVWEWDVVEGQLLAPQHFSKVLEGQWARHLLIGTGHVQRFLDSDLSRFFQQSGIYPEVMTTGAAARTYNILFQEGRPVGAALIAV